MEITYDTKIKNRNTYKYKDDVYRKLKSLLEKELKDFPEVIIHKYLGYTNSDWGFSIHLDIKHRFRKNNKNEIFYSKLYKYKDVQEIIDLVKTDLNNTYRFKPKKYTLEDLPTLQVKNITMPYSGGNEILVELSNGELVTVNVTDFYNTYCAPIEIFTVHL